MQYEISPRYSLSSKILDLVVCLLVTSVGSGHGHGWGGFQFVEANVQEKHTFPETTVDGRNPAPPWMHNTLQIMG